MKLYKFLMFDSEQNEVEMEINLNIWFEMNQWNIVHLCIMPDYFIH